jgi:hypothetical protein
MVMTTVQIAIAPSKPLSRQRARREVGSTVDVIRLSVVGALVWSGAAIGAAAASIVLLATAGAWAIAGILALPGAAFVAVTGAVTLIWVLGAIGTRRTIRRVAPLHELEDRAAFSELATLLAQE